MKINAKTPFELIDAIRNLADVLQNAATIQLIDDTPQQPALQAPTAPQTVPEPSVSPVEADASQYVQTTLDESAEPEAPAPTQPDAATATSQTSDMYTNTDSTPIEYEEHTYTREDIQKAAAELADSGKRAEIFALLKKHGANNLRELPDDKISSIIWDLIKLGASL